MFANERYNYILAALQQHQSVTVSDLVQHFSVSIETIRRDLAYLEQQKLLKRVHGGAVTVKDNLRSFASRSVRCEENKERKQRVAERAAELVSEHDFIAMDSGSTADIFGEVLCSRFKNLTILTYSKDLIDRFIAYEGFTVINPGGTYRAEEHIYYDFFTTEILSRYHVNKSFLFPSSISLENGVTINISEFFNLERTLMKISDHSYLLVDSTKFETNSPIKICGINECDAVVTDDQLDPATINLYRNNGVRLLLPEKT